MSKINGIWYSRQRTPVTTVMQLSELQCNLAVVQDGKLSLKFFFYFTCKK